MNTHPPKVVLLLIVRLGYHDTVTLQFFSLVNIGNLVLHVNSTVLSLGYLPVVERVHVTTEVLEGPQVVVLGFIEDQVQRLRDLENIKTVGIRTVKENNRDQVKFFVKLLVVRQAGVIFPNFP